MNSAKVTEISREGTVTRNWKQTVPRDFVALHYKKYAAPNVLPVSPLRGFLDIEKKSQLKKYCFTVDI